MSFTWNGRQMKTANLNGTSVTYKYNADGQRTYKKVGTTVHEYEYSNGRLYYEKRGDIQFYYRYDAMGNLAAFSRVKADGSKYVLYAICNSRGDVEELRNETGTLFARYVYDSWGNVIHIYNANGNEITSSTNMAVQNPIRYRGYYFDAESGLYYLQSRYYDPVTCRFVNADSLVDTTDVLGFNMYAYCGNNPVARADNSGESWSVLGIMAVGGFIGAAISAVSSAVTQKALTGSVNLKSVGVAAVSGFVSGAVAASPLKIVGQQVFGGVIGGLSYMADCYVNDKEVKLDEAVFSVGAGVISGRIGGSGANEGNVLSEAIEGAEQTITREFRRQNQKYAQKAISKTVNSLNNTLDLAAWNASSKFATGCGVANGLNLKYGELGLFPDAPSCKLW